MKRCWRFKFEKINTVCLTYDVFNGGIQGTLINESQFTEMLETMMDEVKFRNLIGQELLSPYKRFLEE